MITFADFDPADQEAAMKAGFNSTAAWAIHEVVAKMKALEERVEKLEEALKDARA